MSNKVYSFSTNNDKDEELVQRLKTLSKQTGVSFSWLVVQALKETEKLETSKDAD